MLKKLTSADPFKTFYVVFGYILIFSVWWGYLLYAKNETTYTEKIELNQVLFNETHPGINYITTPEFKQIHSKYQRQKVMILTEGGAFIILLFFGFVIARRVFKKEIELAVQQTNFLHSITHELKSPLSTIKISLQTMLKRKLEVEQSEKLINNSLVDLDRLESLVDNILFAAKIERSQHGFAEDDIYISELVAQIADRFADNKRAVKIVEKIVPEVYLHIDAMGFISVVTNLIENAVKYSEPGREVELALEDASEYVKLTIADNGIGIPDEEKKKIFDKFYRVGNEDTRRTKGTGLGLYIVKRFMEIYKGTITVTDNQPGGSVFTLVFPKANKN